MAIRSERVQGLSRRRFLNGLGGAAALLAGAGMSAAASAAERSGALRGLVAATNAADAVSLPPLPYDYNALEPHIDEMTMRIHHTRHHNAFIGQINTALANYPDLAGRSVTDLLVNINDLPVALQPVIRNSGGGHLNHSIFWAVMAPGAGGEPSGALAQAISSAFGNFATFKQQFTATAAQRFGSGWGWLTIDGAGTLQIMSTANQDSPYMMGLTPLLAVDVWEHAYYLKYQNRRGDYLNAWWNTVNWDAVAKRYAAARG